MSDAEVFVSDVRTTHSGVAGGPCTGPRRLMIQTTTPGQVVLSLTAVEQLIPKLQKWLSGEATLRERCDPFLAAIRAASRPLSSGQRMDVETARYATFAALERGEPALALQWVVALEAAVSALDEGATREVMTRAVAGLRGTIESAS